MFYIFYSVGFHWGYFSHNYIFVYFDSMQHKSLFQLSLLFDYDSSHANWRWLYFNIVTVLRISSYHVIMFGGLKNKAIRRATVYHSTHVISFAYHQPQIQEGFSVTQLFDSTADNATNLILLFINLNKSPINHNFIVQRVKFISCALFLPLFIPGSFYVVNHSSHYVSLLWMSKHLYLWVRLLCQWIPLPQFNFNHPS